MPYLSIASVICLESNEETVVWPCGESTGLFSDQKDAGSNTESRGKNPPSSHPRHKVVSSVSRSSGETQSRGFV